MPDLSEYSPEDIERVQHLLKTPEGEKELEKWVKDWVNAHLYSTDASQLIGNPGYTFLTVEIVTAEDRASSTFGDLTTLGPRVTGLSAGHWQFWWGMQVQALGAADDNGQMGLETSWSGLSDSNIASTRLPVGSIKNAAFGRGYNNVDGPQNPSADGFVTAKYRTQAGQNARFSKRWVAGVKVRDL